MLRLYLNVIGYIFLVRLIYELLVTRVLFEITFENFRPRYRPEILSPVPGTGFEDIGFIPVIRWIRIRIGFETIHITLHYAILFGDHPAFYIPEMLILIK